MISNLVPPSVPTSVPTGHPAGRAASVRTDFRAGRAGYQNQRPEPDVVLPLLLGPSITPHSFVAVCSGGASSIEMNEVGSK